MNNQQILRLKSVCAITGLSRSSIYQKMTDNDFPKSIKLGTRSVGWISSDIEAWVQSRIEQSRGTASTSSD